MKQGKLQQKKPYQLTGVDLEILQLVNEYHFLTVEQLIRLRYSKGSLTTVQTKLKALTENKYLDRRHLPHTGTGNTVYVYNLTTKAQQYLQEAGFTGFSRYRRSDILTVKLPHLQHALSLNDVLIAARLLAKDVPAITLAEARHDLDLKKTPVKVTVEKRLPYGDRVD